MWLLIDGNNWFAQCAFANAEEGKKNFFYRLTTLINQIEHARCVVCWDEGIPWRRELFYEYKGERGDKPEGYHELLDTTRAETAQMRGVTSIAVDQYEADDLIATCVAEAAAEGVKCAMFSADKDLHQLILDGSVSQVLTVKRESPTKLLFHAMTQKTLLDRYGVKPWQWVDYRAVTGDKSDGIPGCLGVSDKTAAKVLGVYPSLDEFFKDPWRAPISAYYRTLLLNFRDQVPLSRKLMTLVNDVPLPAAFFQELHAS
jgi:DNA polymerase-1